MEEWRAIDGYEGLYEVSSMGRVKNFRTGYCGPCGTGKNGSYPAIVLKNSNGIVKQVYVHQLVARAFVSGFSLGMVVNHKDGNPKNNASENLEWVTTSLNARHAWFHKRNKSHRQKSVSAYDV